MVRCAALVVVFMFATCRLTFTVSVASVSVMTGTPLELSNLREVSQCPETAPDRAFSLLITPGTGTIKNLLRHHAHTNTLVMVFWTRVPRVSRT